MSENASLAQTTRGIGLLSGLPQRLVQDGVVSEHEALSALQAARDQKSHFVTQLVGSGAAKARDVAIAASTEFGVPLLDLDSLSIDSEVTRLVSDKLLAKHRVLPMFRRGKRLFLGVSDPTDLHAIDEIKFQTGLSVDAVIVEDDKLQKAVDKAIEQVESQMPMRCRWTTMVSTSKDSRSVAATTWKARLSAATTSRTPRSSASSTS